MAPVSTPCASRAPAWKLAPAPGLLINSVAMSADARRVVAGTFYRSYGADAADPNASFGTYCYDATGAQRWWQPIPGAREGVYWVAISRDGRYAASGGLLRSGRDVETAGFIQAFDADTGNPLLAGVETPGRANRVDLSADGSVLVACAGRLVYLSTLSGAAYQRPVDVTLDSTVVSAAVSADGAWIVAGTFGGAIYLLGHSGGALTQVASYPLPAGENCHAVQISAEGDWFAAVCGGAHMRGHVYLCSRRHFTAQPAPFWMHEVKGTSYGLALAGGDAETPPVLAATGNAGYEGQVVVIDTNGAAANVRWAYETLRAPNAVSLDAAASVVAVADGYPENTPGNFYLLDGQSGTCRWSCPSGNMNWPIVVSAAGTAVAAGSDDSNVYYFTN